jgi:hypothetical protein
VEFSNAGGTVLETSTPLTIRVDNNHCGATVATPVLETSPPATADPNCGLLHYVTKNATPVSMAFTASHPNGFATFVWELIKGVHLVSLPPGPPPPPPTSGPVSSVVSPISDSVSNLLRSTSTCMRRRTTAGAGRVSTMLQRPSLLCSRRSSRWVRGGGGNESLPHAHKR